MTPAVYERQNRAKTSFDSIYTAPTPGQYLRTMAAVGYRMAEYMRPFLSAVVDASVNPDAPVKVLDVGCSYGMSAALLKTHCTYKDLEHFFTHDASIEPLACATESARWLQTHGVQRDVEIVGFDSSEAAINFATASKMIDEGIARNLEEKESSLTPRERRAIQECDVFFSTGAIGYITDKTIRPILAEFGHRSPGALGPVAVMSVLELFDPEPIADVFAAYGFQFVQLGIRMPQRRFADDAERDRVLDTLQQRGLPTEAQEADDRMFAGLCVAARPERCDTLTRCVTRENLAGQLHERPTRAVVNLHRQSERIF